MTFVGKSPAGRGLNPVADGGFENVVKRVIVLEDRHITNLTSIIYRMRMAEEEGFEPPRPLRALRFSRPPPSTTRPFLRPSSD